MAYERKTWDNVPDPSSYEGDLNSLPRFDAENMNRIEGALDEAYALSIESKAHISNTSNPHRLTADSVNAQGLVGGTLIKENDDLNSYTTVGNYACNLTTTAQTLSNCPIAEAFRMTIGYTSGSDIYLYQEIIHYYTGVKYYRTYAVKETRWNDWITYYNTSNKPTLTELGAAPAYSYGTADLEAGKSELATGKLYLVYE